MKLKVLQSIRLILHLEDVEDTALIRPQVELRDARIRVQLKTLMKLIVAVMLDLPI